MTASQNRANAKLPKDVEEAPEPPMTEAEKRAFIKSLEEAEAGIARGEYTLINPETFLEDLKKKLFPNNNPGPK